MLLQFKVKNFRSIRDEAYLSLIPSSDKEHPENLAHTGGRQAVKSIAIYGANAAGKSNVILAFVAAIMAVRTSDIRNVGQKISSMVPFKLDEKTAKEPCSFEFFFIGKDGIPYRYGFSADEDRVHEEYLYWYASTRPSRIFERTGDKFDYNKAEESQLKVYEKKNAPNKLFLATATNWNCEKTAPAYQWLAESIDVYLSDFPMKVESLEKYQDDPDGDLKRFTLQLLRQADINIDDIDVQFVPLPMTVSAYVNNTETPLQGQARAIKIHAGHKIEAKSGEQKQFYFDLNEESLGTKQLFQMSPVLKDVLEKGRVMVIDELGRGLHPFLVKFLVDLFHNPQVNKTGAQLVFSTHDTSLLSLDTFRRDQIYFVEKDPRTAATDLYSLDEFSVRKSENIEKGYLLGRYGAIPYLRPEGAF